MFKTVANIVRLYKAHKDPPPKLDKLPRIDFKVLPVSMYGLLRCSQLSTAVYGWKLAAFERLQIAGNDRYGGHIAFVHADSAFNSKMIQECLPEAHRTEGRKLDFGSLEF